MPFGRAIVAILVAFAVTLLPASGGLAFADKSHALHGHAAVVDEFAAAAEADQAAPCDHDSSAVDDCGSLAVCALKCFTYAGLRLPSLQVPFSAACAPPGRTTDIVASRDGAPPFRPPRA